MAESTTRFSMRSPRGSRPEGDPLPRYRSIVPDWQRFVEACRRPLPTVVRTNTLRTEPDALRDRLVHRGLDPEPVAWEPTLFTVSRPAGRTIEHWLGLLYAQEAVQLAPVLALDPRPGEAVLDLCAAPGGKTTHLAARMGGVGPLVVNEPSGRRQPALLANVNRLGVLNATVTSYRGESFPQRATFDRILVDAPCSAEGTLRKESSLWNGATPSTIQRLARLQKRLIVRAFDLLTSRGSLVYSTCTLAPEENEAVVAHLLAQRSARIASLSLPFSASEGLTTWNGDEFPDELARCVRIYPHQIDSGGGFVARIERE